MVAPLFSACSKVSRTSTPAPSPITKPARSMSNGLDPLVGSSLNFVFIAFIAQNPAKLRGVMAASLPPAIMMSASPRRIACIASPMACDPTAHAEVTPKLGPWAPNSMPMMPEAVLPRRAGMVKGETFLGPLLSSLRVWSSYVCIPPKAEPTMTPNLVLSTFPRSSPESSTAILPAPMARWVNLSLLLAVLALVKKSPGVKSGTSEPIWHV
mmetsp:Transcript_42877/g.99616  ORF Transcript_42877/g.99616 Transcript_42877/m.99616 type:complete len:211 (+) Transcript_42877:622-1254(+)